MSTMAVASHLTRSEAPAPLATPMPDAHSAPLLDAEEEQALGRRIQAGRRAREHLRLGKLEPEERSRLEAAVADGATARSRFVEANQRLVFTVARRFRGHSLEFEDLVQEGNLGLIRAVERFDPERGLRFSTYAVWWIRQAIQRAIEERGRLIRLPGHATEEAARLWRAVDQLAADLERAPDLAEAARASGLDADRARELAQVTLRPVSLESTVDANGEVTLGDVLPGSGDDPEEEIERAAIADLVQRGLDELPERSRQVLELRFGLEDGQPRTLVEVGQALGISRERARQLEAEGMRRLRRALHPLRPVLTAR
jgi:RNA polymerase primary sigma factor